MVWDRAVRRPVRASSFGVILLAAARPNATGSVWVIAHSEKKFVSFFGVTHLFDICHSEMKIGRYAMSENWKTK